VSELLPIKSLTALRGAEQKCKRCPLYKHATQVVPGEGPARARIMLVGEQPGDQEDKQGKPFVGPAGSVLRKPSRMLESSASLFS
jgi:DNA polymerase